MKERIVTGKNVEFSYGSNRVLDNVSFHIDRGDFVGIIGPNGSAKSTLLKLMLGLLKPDRGSISLFGEKVEEFTDFQRIGYISQNVRDFNQMFPATVEEIVGLNIPSRRGLLRNVRLKNRERIEEALKIVGMDRVVHERIGNLSGGQKQKVFIARAIVNRPEILFMDEPLVGIDQDSQKDFYRLMGILNREHKISLVIISHDVDVISGKANRIFGLGNGNIIFQEAGDNNGGIEI